jgi:outer membrane cobalamin receptor
LGGNNVRDIDDIPVGDVALIEVVSGASGGWSYGTGGAGGVIKIHTKRGRGLLLADPESCELPNW